MKSRLLAIVLGIALIGFSGCPGSTEKSSETGILTFKVGTVNFEISSAGVISALYPKTPPTPPATEGTWANWPANSMSTALVTLKDTKARMNPDPTVTPINIENGSFKVIAEDGTEKTYTLAAQKGSL